MKKTFILLLCALLIGGTLLAQEVPEIQKTMLTKRTATWCTFCGGWGWSFFEDLIEDNSENALLVAAHFSGELQTPTSVAITTNYGGFSQPRFFINNMDQGVNSGNASTKRTEIKAAVDQAAAQAPIVNAGIIATLEEGTVTAKVKTTFFQNTSGEYYLGLYIIEDGVINFQTSQGPNAMHHNILRTAFTDGHFGEVIAEGDIDAGTSLDRAYAVELSPSWVTENIKVTAILWQREGDDYIFVNANFVEEFSTPTSIATIELEGVELILAPTVTQSNTTVTVQLDRPLDNAQLTLTDVNGKLVRTIYNNPLAQGEHSFIIEKSIAGNGLYFLSLSSEGKTLTKRLIFQ